MLRTRRRDAFGHAFASSCRTPRTAPCLWSSCTDPAEDARAGRESVRAHELLHTVLVAACTWSQGSHVPSLLRVFVVSPKFCRPPHPLRYSPGPQLPQLEHDVEVS